MAARWRIVLLLVPARSILFVAAAAAASLILILIHQIHFLMYVPTIAAIVVLRYYLVHGVSRQNAIAGIVACASVGLLFLVVQFYGSMAVPEDRLIDHLRGRMADPSQTRLLSFSYIWYQNLATEIHDTWARMPSNLLGIPVFALLIWLHAPLWRYFAALIRSLSDDLHRRVVIAAIVAVSAGLPDYLRGRVRLFAVDFELGGLHVPDPACGEDAAGCGCRAGGGRGSAQHGVRLDRDADSARGDRAAVLDAVGRQ